MSWVGRCCVAALLAPCVAGHVAENVAAAAPTWANHTKGRVHDMEMILLLHARLPMTIASGTRVLKQVTYDDDDSKLDLLRGASRQDRLSQPCLHLYHGQKAEPKYWHLKQRNSCTAMNSDPVTSARRALNPPNPCAEPRMAVRTGQSSTKLAQLMCRPAYQYLHGSILSWTRVPVLYVVQSCPRLPDSAIDTVDRRVVALHIF